MPWKEKPSNEGCKMTPDRMIELLKIERACVIKNNGTSCDRECEKCILCQDSEELIAMYDDVIAQMENRIPFLIQTVAELTEESDVLYEEVKKRRKDKKRWKKKALKYKEQIKKMEQGTLQEVIDFYKEKNDGRD